MLSSVNLVIGPEPPLARAQPPSSPARVTSADPDSSNHVPVVRVLTARALLARRPNLLPTLRTAACAVRLADDWSDLLEQAERQQTDVVIVDLDAAQAQTQPRQPTMSGYRLVALLARRALRLGFVVLLQTRLDFSEVEDLMRQGIHLLVHPDLPDELLARHISDAIRHRNGAPVPVGAPGMRVEHGGYVADWLSYPKPADVPAPAD